MNHPNARRGRLADPSVTLGRKMCDPIRERIQGSLFVWHQSRLSVPRDSSTRSVTENSTLARQRAMGQNHIDFRLFFFVFVPKQSNQQQANDTTSWCNVAHVIVVHPTVRWIEDEDQQSSFFLAKRDTRPEDMPPFASTPSHGYGWSTPR